MDTLHKLEKWADTHHPIWIDYIRIVLGLYLVFKGIIFVSNPSELLTAMSGADLFITSMTLIHYIAFSHIIGGILIAVGLLTRFAAVLQLPILFGAVFLVNPQLFFIFGYNFEFWSSVVVLLLLILFLFYGSGKLSVSGYSKEHPNS